MNIEDAQKLADQAIIAGLQGSLENVRKVGFVRKQLATRIMEAINERQGESAEVLADQIMASLGGAFTVSRLPEGVVKAALVTALGI